MTAKNTIARRLHETYPHELISVRAARRWVDTAIRDFCAVSRLTVNAANVGDLVEQYIDALARDEFGDEQ